MVVVVGVMGHCCDGARTVDSKRENNSGRAMSIVKKAGSCLVVI